MYWLPLATLWTPEPPRSRWVGVISGCAKLCLSDSDTCTCTHSAGHPCESLPVRWLAAPQASALIVLSKHTVRQLQEPLPE